MGQEKGFNLCKIMKETEEGVRDPLKYISTT